MSNLTEYGKFIRKLRIDKNINQKEHAELLGVSATFLSSIEKGKKAINLEIRYYVATAQNYNNQLFNKKEAKLNLASLKITISNLYKTNITNDYLYFDYV